MKCILRIALLPMLGAALCDAADEAKPPFKHKLAADFGECPDGHKALVDVPIVWGLVGPLYKKPADYNAEDRALKLREERGEIVFGGDTPPTHKPKTEVICRECGFRYHSMCEDLPPDVPMDWWLKSAKKPEEFRIKFSKTLLDFPLLNAQQRSVSYHQSLNADGKQLDSESISYHTILTMDGALSGMRTWLAGIGRSSVDLKPAALEPPAIPADPFSPPTVPAPDGKDPRPNGEQPGAPSPSNSHNYEYNTDGIWLMVKDDTFWEPGKILISLTLRPTESREKSTPK